jgi:hypothetical protein
MPSLKDLEMAAAVSAYKNIRFGTPTLLLSQYWLKG